MDINDKSISNRNFWYITSRTYLFLKKSKSYGDELHVIISRDKNIKHKKKPIIDEYQRYYMISELKIVDYVYLGDLNN